MSQGCSTTPGRVALSPAPSGNRAVASKIAFSNKTPSQKMDRFITARSAMDVDAAHLSLMKENNDSSDAGGASAAACEAKEEYKRQLAATMGVDQARVLAFKHKAPAPAEGHDNKLSGMYSANTGQGPERKKFRHVPDEPKNVLGAPDIVNDFYLNVLDWSSQNVVAVALKETVYLWNGSSGAVSQLCALPEGQEGNDRYVCSLSWAADGNFLAVGTSDAKVQIWDTQRGRQVRELTGHTNRVSCVAWNGSMLSSGGRDSVVANWDVRKKREEACVAMLRCHEQEVCGLRWSPCGQQLASGANDNMLCIHNARFEQQHKINAHTSAVKAMAWCPFQSNLLATGGGTADRHMRFWNTHTGAMLNEIDTGSQVCSLVWNRHEREILSSHGYHKNQLSLWKYPSMVKVADLMKHSGRVLHMAPSPDGLSVMSAGADEQMCLWECFGLPAGVGKGTEKPEPVTSMQAQHLRSIR